ncbi:hypothetical protein GCM10010145_23090 [Streptomyces ruber]|uniref:DUF11 domain-containing protein n=2 Tax=Streptomyces TaxID=1883 RepID=A0A918BAE1_9ACTN|nr:hypothetical protein GCM10010145_23090 [Streptomyces ruber]
MLLLVPLLGVTAASGQDATGPGTRAVDAADTRVAYAGTLHRSLGRVAAGSTTSSPPLFGEGPAHYDTQPSAFGDTLVFASRRDEKDPQVYLRAADGSVHRLTTGMNAAHPRLTPDGGAVVFDSPGPGSPDGRGQRDLWSVRTDGSDALTRLTDTPANEQWPTVSPDGRRLAYSSDSDPLAGRQVHVRPLAGGTASRLTDPANGEATEPVWNPVDDAAHRNRIVYTATAEEGRPQLRMADGSTDKPWLAGAYERWRAHGAAWMPDGNEVLFLSPEVTCTCTSGWDHVYRATEDLARDPATVLDEDREVGSPTWLDGGVVVERVTADRPNEVTLQDARADGADPRDLGLDPLLREDPAADTDDDRADDPLFRPAPGFDPWTERQNYTPDGRRIVFTRFTGPAGSRAQQIYMVDADGSNEELLPLAGREPTDWDTDPAFSPDGRYLAFTRTSPGGVGEAAGPSRILVAEVATGEITGEVVPPAGELQGQDAQPTWSSDGTTLAFTRNHAAYGTGGNKHVWTVRVDDLGQQRDVSATLCPDSGCQVLDDSPAFSPDGLSVAFNRGGRADERNGILLASLSDDDCRVLLPAAARDVPDACRQQLPDTSETGPFQPRDAAWTADGTGLVFSSRAAVEVDSPEKLSRLDIASGDVTPLTGDLPGRQKEPSVQPSVDLAVRAPGTAPELVVGGSATIRVDVVNNGPAASPGTRLTVVPPPGVRITGITRPGGTCDAASLVCDVGVVPPGATVPVDVTLTGLTPGDAPVDWSVTGTVLDPQPGDNAGRTVVPVREAPPTSPPPTTGPPTTPPPTTEPPTPEPPTSEPPTAPPPAPAPPTTPAPPPVPPEPEPPEAGPGVRVTAQPNPGFVGGRVVVTYTVRNGRDALATGLRLRIGLPAGVPGNGPPQGCDDSWVCALPDLEPGASTVVRVVLSPNRALTADVTGSLTTTGTDADRSDNTARERLRILQPRIEAVPEIGKPGFVTSVRGRDFPPGVPVRFTWDPGITAAAAPTVPKPDGTFTGQLLILAKDRTGPRVITARGSGFSPVTTGFLVVSGTVQPPDEVTRR